MNHLYRHVSYTVGPAGPGVPHPVLPSGPNRRKVSHFSAPSANGHGRLSGTRSSSYATGLSRGIGSYHRPHRICNGSRRIGTGNSYYATYMSY